MYYVSSGEVSSGIILENNSMTVFGGGTANSTTVNSRGGFYVSSDGIANSATVNSGGSLTISSGGTATEIIENGGYVDVEEGAQVTFVANEFSNLVLSYYASATVHSGTTANNTTVNSRAKLYVCSGGTAMLTAVSSDGSLNISSSGTATLTVVSPGGSLHVSAGGTATDLVADNCFLSFAISPDTYIAGTVNGSAFEIKDGLISDHTINRGRIEVVSGGTAKRISVDSGALLYVFSGGTATEIMENGGSVVFEDDAFVSFTSNSFSGLNVGGDTSRSLHSGTTATDITVNCGNLHVSSGGVANNASVIGVGPANYHPGSLLVSSGGVANNVKVKQFGSLIVSSGGIANSVTCYGDDPANRGGGTVVVGGTANDTVITSYGRVVVSSGGIVNKTSVGADGSLSVISGGTANNTNIKGYKLYSIYGIATYKQDAIFSVSCGGTANGSIIEKAGCFYLSSGGMANDTMINDRDGTFHVSSGGTANNTTVNGGTFHVSSGGTAGNTTVNDGTFHVSFGGTANDTTVNGRGAVLHLSSGGTASKTVISGGGLIVFGGLAKDNTMFGGSLSVSSGGMATGITVYSGSVVVVSGGTAQGITAGEKAQMFLAIAPDTFVSGKVNGLSFEIKNGIASDFVMGNGTLSVLSGGTANNITVNSTGNLTVSSGGTATSTKADKNGFLQVSSGGTATEIVENGGYVEVADGGTATFASNTFSGLILSNASATVHFGTTANNIAVHDGGKLYLYSGGTATEVVENGGYVDIADGGTATFASNTFSGLVLSNASATVHSGTTANNIAVHDGGKLYLYFGGKMTGTTFIADGATVSASDGAILDFDISVLSSGESPLINNLSAVSGWENLDYTLTVSDMQTSGTYVLAEGAADFNRTITVQDTLGISLNTLSVNQTIQIGEEKYSLNLANGVLSLTVRAPVIGMTISNETQVVSAYEIYRETTIDAGGRFYVYSGGTATDPLVNPGGTLCVDAGGTATEIAENGGYAEVENGANVKYAENSFSGVILSNAFATVHSGTTAISTTVNNGGELYVFSGGTAIEVVENGGYVDIADGGTATFASNTFSGLILSNASATVHSGTTATNTTVNNGGELYVFSGGTATEVVENGGYVEVENGANVKYAENSFSGLVLSNTSATVHSGTTANTTMVNECGRLAVYSGGTANDTVIKGGGWVEFEDNGYWYESHIGLCVFDGGIANDTTINEGYMFVSGGTANSTTVNSGGSLYVSSGGSANDTTINEGRMNVSGGVANSTTVNARGTMYVSSDGVANNTTLNGACYYEDGYDTCLFISSGGTAYGVTVSPYTMLCIQSGGTATDIAWTPCEGFISIEDGAHATFVSQYSGVYLGSDGKLVSSAVSMDSGTIGEFHDSSSSFDGSVPSRGAQQTVQDSSSSFDGDVIYVMSGGTANSMIVRNGYYTAEDGLREQHTGMFVHSGGTANDTMLKKKGVLYVSSGGIANGTVIEDEGHLHVFSGGTANNTTINECYGTFNVSSGGSANDTTINEGRMNVSGGGMASNTTLSGFSGPHYYYDEYDAFLYVSSGGVAYGVTVSPYTMLCIQSGGTATDIAWTPCEGFISIEDGAHATFVSQYSGVYLGSDGKLVSSAVSMDGKTVDDVSVMYVMNGGTVSSTTIYDGMLFIQSGGIANDTTASGDYCHIYVSDGGVANGATLNNDATMLVLSGGTANNTVVKAGYAEGRGWYDIVGLSVSSGGVANGVTVASNGVFVVSSGGVADGVAVSGGVLHIYSGGTATGVAWTPGNGTLYLDDCAFVTLENPCSGVYYKPDDEWAYLREDSVDALEKYCDEMYVMADGVATNIKVENQTLAVFSGGVANGVAVSGGGILRVYSGGTATDVAWTPGKGQVSVYEGASVSFASRYSGVYLVEGDQTTHTATASSKTIGETDEGLSELYVMADGIANDTVILNREGQVWSGGTANRTTLRGGRLSVSSGGIANDTALAGYLFYNGDDTEEKSWPRTVLACLSVSSGGTANRTAVGSKALAEIRSGGTANSTTVYADGVFRVVSGGIAMDTVVSGGSFHVLSGGTATDIAWTPCEGFISIEDGAHATFASRYSGVYYGSDGQLTSSASVMEGKTIGFHGEMYVMTDGRADGTTVNPGGRMHVASGGIANVIDVNDHGELFVSSGGTANAIAVDTKAALTVCSGGTANDITVNADGILSICSGGIVNGTEINAGGHIQINVGAALNGATLNGSIELVVSSGITMNKTIVNSDAKVEILSGAIMNSATVYGNGYLEVSSGGVVSNPKAYAGGTVKVTSGAKVTGKMNFAAGAVIFVEKGSNIDFDLTQTAAGGKALLSDWSLLQGSPDYTLTVSGNQANGIYTLANGAEDFEGTLSVQNVLGKSLGTLMTGETLTVGTVQYALDLDNETLTLTVSGNVADTVAPTITGVTANITTPTNLNVTVTAIFEDNVGVTSALYRIGETGDWIVYEDGVTVSENATVYFKAIDASGNESEIASYTVGNIETTSDNIISGLLLSNRESATAFANDIYRDTVISGGILFVSSGGITNNTVIDAGGLNVKSGGMANDTTVNSGGLTVEYDGVANNNTVNPGGEIHVMGGTATNIVENGGYVEVYGGTATFASNTFSGLSIINATVHSGTTAVSTTVTHGGYGLNYYNFSIFSGGIANFTNVFGFDPMYATVGVWSGGTANNTMVDVWGNLEILEGGTANSTTIKGGEMTVFSGGVANDTVVSSDGALVVSSGGTATNIDAAYRAWLELTVVSNTYVQGKYDGCAFEMKDARISGYDFCEGNLLVSSGGIADSSTVNLWGALYVFSGGTAKNTMVNTSGKISIFSGGLARDTEINSCGSMIVSGGLANRTIVNASGEAHVCSEGIASNVIVNSGGKMIISKGIITGQMTFARGAVVSVYENAVVDFNISTLADGASARINNLSIIQGAPVYTLTVSDMQASGTYTLAEGAAEFNGTISVQNAAGESFGALAVGETLKVGYNIYTLSVTDSSLSMTVEVPDLTPTDTIGTAEQVSWETTGANSYIVEYSTDNFKHIVMMVTTGEAIDMPDLPAGTYQWRVKADANSGWSVGEAIVSEAESGTPKVVQSNKDGNDDLFFVTPVGTWESIYYAQHVGSINDWTGTNDLVSAGGKGRIQNLFFGSTDPNVLCLTDGENGDAIFVDDVYTDLPEGLEEHTARLYRIQEIRAGFGDDIVDMTSQRFEYIGEGLTIRGGAGNDTIWANKGDNKLFGDAGNDRIIGASGNDVIAGGIGNDRLHGGGGDDVFTFCDNWGVDNVEQLTGGSVTLWFASGSEANWNAETLTYTDGENSVKVSGVTADKVTLKFGDDASDQFAMLSSMGAFFDATTERIFEESGKGILASMN